MPDTRNRIRSLYKRFFTAGNTFGVAVSALAILRSGVAGQAYLRDAVGRGRSHLGRPSILSAVATRGEGGCRPGQLLEHTMGDRQ